MIVPSAGDFTSSSIFIDSTMMIVCPLETFVPFAKHCLRSVPATGAFTSSPPTVVAAAATGAEAPAAPNVTL